MYYLKLYYKLLDWEWYTDANVMRLFIHCMLKANVKTKKWLGTTIERGSFITSYSHLAQELGLTVQQIRTAIQKLESTGEITRRITRNQQGSNTLITINNYNEYQPDNTQNNTRITLEQHSDNTRVTTTKECKINKNEKEVVEEEKLQLQENQKIYGEFQNVCLTDENYNKLLGICLNKKLLEELINQLSEKIGTGDENPYNAQCPDAHYIRLRSYYNFRKKNPDKFQEQKEEHSKVLEEWYKKEKARLAAKGIH